ncbi:MAG: hypothetical protein WBN75_06480 [Verrucomicrobiia bacterium]
MNVNSITEAPLAADVQGELRQYEAAALSALRLGSVRVDEDGVVEAISKFADSLLASDAEIDNEVVTQLGVLWGHQICCRLGWEWVELTIQDDMWYGIVSRRREYAIFPLILMREVLAERSKENTILLIYNMLKAGKFSPAEPDDYHVLE